MFVKPVKGGQFLTRPGDLCPQRGETLKKITTGCDVKRPVISGALIKKVKTNDD